MNVRTWVAAKSFKACFYGPRDVTKEFLQLRGESSEIYRSGAQGSSAHHNRRLFLFAVID